MNPIVTCEICGNDFNTRRISTKVQTQNGQRELFYKCPYCGMKYHVPLVDRGGTRGNPQSKKQ